MRDYVSVNFGASIDLRIVYSVDGDPVDLTAITMSIEQASPAVLLSAALTKSDPEQGECLLTLSATEASELPMGRLSWFRLGRAVGDVIDVSPKIWINVK